VKPVARRRLEIPGGAAKQLAVRPDPPNRPDRPRRQRHREIGRIAVGDGLGPALAAAALRTVLAQVRRPDDGAGDPHRPEQLRDLAAVARGLHRQLAQPGALARLGREQPAVDLLADDGAQGAADRAADRGSDRGKDESRHQISSPAARHAPTTGQGTGSGRSTTRRSEASA
jgi:hypothetical protein